MKKIITISLLIIFLSAWLCVAEVKVYFSPSNKVDRIILEKLKHVRKSVLIVSYTFDWQEGYRILKDLAGKGIEVKILLNFPPENFIKGCKVLDIKGWNKKRSALHAKFLVIDSKYAFVGSANFTESSLAWDSNNILFIDDETIGKFLTENFFSLWSNSSLSQTCSIKTNEIEFYFSPSSACMEIIVNEIKKAKETLKFAMFCFTSDIIGQEIIRAGIKGIRVYGIFEGSQNPISNEYIVMKKIHLLKIKKDCFVKNIHDKFLIIDDKTVLTGSFNYTTAATRNIETFIILREPKIVSAFTKRWRYLWLWY
ncbi:MAG: phospholipase D-like domain-containing protein [bacterium]|nr:phospholipase D-like domain-containing protein [bacterium]